MVSREKLLYDKDYYDLMIIRFKTWLDSKKENTSDQQIADFRHQIVCMVVIGTGKNEGKVREDLLGGKL